VIWGGFHPSVRPDECMAHADFVAVGDAEDLVLRLCDRLENGGGFDDIKSLVWKRGAES
jgi:radical SAM superfamily enzyme YgiQ (UPF0313 family)